MVCPWCSPTTPKFKRGRLCWFPEEAVLRFVGWRCAKSHLDSDSMREADKRWADEQKKRSSNAFLRENCDRVEGLLKAAQRLEDIAVSCDQFHGRFSRDHSEVYSDLARYVRDGRLYIDQTLGSGARRLGSGSISVLFGVLDGVKVLKGKPFLGKRLAVTRAQLESIAAASHKARFGELSHLDDQERHVLHVVIQEAHKELVRIIRTIEDFQFFMNQKNIELLNGWCSHENSEVFSCGIDVALLDGTLRFGYRVNGNRCTTIVRADDAMFVRPPFVDALRRGEIEKAS